MGKFLLSLLMWLLFGMFQMYVEFYSGIASILTTLINIILVLGISVSCYQRIGKAKLFFVVLFYTVWAIIEMLVFFCVNSAPIGYQQANLIGEVISRILMIIGVYLFSMLGEKKAMNSPLKNSIFFFYLYLLEVYTLPYMNFIQ